MYACQMPDGIDVRNVIYVIYDIYDMYGALTYVRMSIWVSKEALGPQEFSQPS